jgi:arabinan endo-1,5-alpha-L-arabinosidase
VLPNGSSIDNPGRKDPWAPDVHLVGDEYFLYYAVSTFGSQVSAIGLATSSTMEPGTWTDKGGVGVASKKGQAYNTSTSICTSI